VLYTEDFDNLTIGDLSTDPTGNTPGQGNWYVWIQQSTGQAKIISETNRGNVLAIGLSSFLTDNVKVDQKGLDVLWNNRTPGNNILHIEYDCYIVQTLNAGILSYTVLWNDKKDLFRALSSSRYFPSQNVDDHIFEASYWNPASGKQSFPLGSNGSNGLYYR
jgi:hypothetical protein